MQPEVLAARSAPGMEPARQVARLLARPDVTHLVVAARGSSDNAARYAQYLYGHQLRLATYLAAPSLYGDGVGPALSGAAVMGISQSGQSPDVVHVLEVARSQRRPTVAITNDPESPIARTADVVVPLLAGSELSVAATKSYTATLHALAQIAVAAGADGLTDGLARLPDLIAQSVDAAFTHISGSLLAPTAASTGEPVDASITPPPTTAVGRGTGFATAAESALKIREVAGVRAEAYPVPDLLHGPVAANGPGSFLWMIASPSYPVAYWEAVAAPLAAAGVRVIALAEKGTGGLTADIVLRLPPGLPAWLFDFVAVVNGQVAALRLGEQAALDVDHPRGLRKVTRTT
ncbi:MAG: SIS domain-containing protein [Nocardioidaceae bacterium]